jgi:hypothetical protein
MKKLHFDTLALVIAIALLPLASRADESRSEDVATNRFTLSARFGFNISAKFKSISAPTPPTVARTAPDGQPYNYDDGYVHTDVSENFGGQTWNWGYDNNSRQVVGNTIEMSRTISGGNIPSSTVDADTGLGFEFAYSRQLGFKGKFRYGFEAAINYLNITCEDHSTFSVNGTRQVDAYGFIPGTTPPEATPGNPYQGSFNGPGFVIDTNFVSRMEHAALGTGTGSHKLDADLWGLRLGPYAEFPLGDKWRVSLSAGLALGLVNADVSWKETVGTTGISASGQDDEFLIGGYAAANIAWDFSERWSAVAGVQYQGLGDYKHTFGGRRVELDLSSSIFVTVGLGFRF